MVMPKTQLFGIGLRPERVDLEPGRHHLAVGLRGRFLLEQALADAERDEQREKSRADEHVACPLHTPYPPLMSGEPGRHETPIRCEAGKMKPVAAPVYCVCLEM